MAIYSNFDGTMRSSITVGKGGSTITKTSDGDFSISKLDATGKAIPMRLTNVAPAITDLDAVSLAVLKGKFGTANDQVRLNSDLDNRYEQLGRKNIANGYVGLGTDGKIESQFLPSIAINKVTVQKNKYSRNLVTGLNPGDTCVIQGTPVYNPNISYSQDVVVRTVSGGVMKFYRSKSFVPVASFDAVLWSNSWYQPGASYAIGDIVLNNNIVYRAKAAVTGFSVNDLLDTALFERYSDGIFDYMNGVDYPLGTFVKRVLNGTPFFYRANSAVPGMPENQWASTTIEVMKAYKIGDEVIHNAVNYIVIKDHTTPVMPDPTNAGQSVNYVKDDQPDAGLYILTRAPTGPAGTSVDPDWVAIGVGLNVETFNGRTGGVTSQSGDYSAFQVNSVAHDDVASGDVQKAINFLADSRVKKAGDKMIGTLVIAHGSPAAPSLAIPTSSKSGMYDDNGSVGFAIEGVEKISIGRDSILVDTILDMNSKVISRVGDPQAAGDAVNMKYVDSKPLVLSGTSSPLESLGKDGDVYMTVLGQGPIAMPSTDLWTDLATDGVATIVVNGNSVPVAGLTLNNGLTWTQSIMPAASASSSDQFVATASNNSDSFIAVRRITDMSKNTGKIVYTLDRGRTWNQASTFGGNGSYVSATVYPDSTAYMLFPVSNSNTAYMSTSGDVWSAVTLPVSTTWACASGARGCYVALEHAPTTGTNVVVYQDFGNIWRKAAMADTLVWRSVTTADGVNYVAVGEKSGAAKDTNVVNYSNNRGATWSTATLPSSGRWSAVSSNGTTFVAVRQNSNKGAYSSDNGRTWIEITLPAVRGWNKMVANPRMYMALSTDTSSNSAVAVSTDGGRTWTSEITGQIADINFKNGGKWLAYASMGSGTSNNLSTSSLYVRRDGDKMTGSLVISHDQSKDSLIASGAILAPTLKATKYATNDMSTKNAGSIFMGTQNADAVDVGNIFGFSTITQGTSGGFSLLTTASVRGAAGAVTEKEMVSITKDTFNLNGSVGIGALGVAYANSALTVDVSTKKHGITVFSGTDTVRNNTSMVSLASNTKDSDKYAIEVRAACRAISKTADAPFSDGDRVFGLTTNGTCEIAKSLMVGMTKQTNHVATLNLSHDNATADSVMDMSISAMPVKSGIAMRYTDFSKAPVGYSHLNIEEGVGVSVLMLNSTRFMVNKKVQLNASAAKNISLYVGGTDAVRIPAGTTAQRPASGDTEAGMMRYNSTITSYEMYDATKGWQTVQLGKTSTSGLLAAASWVSIELDTEGHNFKFEIPQATHQLPAWPFVDFQSSVSGSAKYRSTSYDYEVTEASGSYTITVYAYFEKDADKESVRWKASC